MPEILTPEQVKTIQAWLPEAVTVEAVVQEAERLIASHEALLAERDAATRKAFEEAAGCLESSALRLLQAQDKIPQGWSYVNDEAELLYEKAEELRRRAGEGGK